MNKTQVMQSASRIIESRSSNQGSGQDLLGRIVTHYGHQLDVETLEGPHAGSVQRCHKRANLPPLVAGDLILWKPDPSGTGVVISLCDRENVFGRHSPDGTFKPLASNLNCVLIVFAAAPEASANLIDKYLVAIENLGLEAFLILNKVDLLSGSRDQSLQRILQIYNELGYPVFEVSAKSGEGISLLERKLSGQTTVLVGQSGVGKSSLINCLGSSVLAKVGNLSEKKLQGTHTTTTTRLYHLREFDLIDSPGVREFGLSSIKKHEVLRGFRELHSLASDCKFRDCGHGNEPGCAVRTGISTGKVSQERFDSYQNILSNLD